jgi:hypothetical protein
MKQFAEWLSQTPVSLVIQTHEWVIPTIQAIHIVAIGAVVGSVFMIGLRILGWAGRDQTLTQTTARFGPWLSWSLGVLLLTGTTMIVGEPARELLAVSFWLKMGLVAVGAIVTIIFRRSLTRRPGEWETSLVHRPGIRRVAVLTLLIWALVVVLGRLIAYDYVWGSWSQLLRG